MLRLRAMPVLVLAPIGSALVLGALASCDTHAVGIDECRQIETARCHAARNCDFGIDSDAKETICDRFVHDNCLHGLPTKEVPRASALDRCVSAIQLAGKCAGDDAKAAASDCGIRGTFSPSDSTVCEFIESPEYSSECSFLAEIEYPDAAAPATEDSGSSAATDAGSQ
jgi:hypothetical protein